jgi:hypothetical protein
MDVCLLWVLYCQVEVSATGWSLVQSSPTECGVFECDREASIMMPRPPRGLLRHWKKIASLLTVTMQHRFTSHTGSYRKYRRQQRTFVFLYSLSFCLSICVTCRTRVCLVVNSSQYLEVSFLLHVISAAVVSNLIIRTLVNLHVMPRSHEWCIWQIRQ